MTLIAKTFEALKEQNKPALITFICGGDPNYDTYLRILKNLPDSGADLIEIGMPFSDPMADGPSIQKGNLRALESGMTLAKTLQSVREFREGNNHTPIILMGYYNPIYQYGSEKFLDDAVRSGVNGLIIVDLPPEEDEEFCLPAKAAGLDFIRLATPTTDDHRMGTVLANSSGFLYYVSITGITGSAAPDHAKVETALDHLRQHCALPIAVGFGIKTPDQAATVAKFADAAVVGSALVNTIEAHGVDDPDGLVSAVSSKVSTLANAVHQARSG